MRLSIILAIESSCDDTAVAVWKDGVVLSNIAASQNVHALYGGVIPELASRAHLQHIIPVIDVAIKKAAITLSDIDAIAVTAGPGLIGSLMVGVHAAKSLALAWGKPLIAVNHIEAHNLSPLITPTPPSFPYLCLTVSGGHTQIVRVNSADDMPVLGKTRDDAAGEAFDKCAKMLNLPYPGGPLLDKHSQSGNPHAYTFPIPHMDGYDFSFSGFKTSVLYFLQRQTKQQPDFIETHMSDICASVQYSIINILLSKLQKAVDDTGIHHVAIAGGVSANSGLRKALEEKAVKNRWQVYIPEFEYCTDNAAMIANAAYYKFMQGNFADMSLSPSARI